MGMFNDYRNTRRDEWRFTYTGFELLAAAKKKLEFFCAKEKEAREKTASLLTDVCVKASDKRIEDLKKEIEKFGDEKEKCTVWVHEFARHPQNEYSLALGDVSYFDLAGEANEGE